MSVCTYTYIYIYIQRLPIVYSMAHVTSNQHAYTDSILPRRRSCIHQSLAVGDVRLGVRRALTDSRGPELLGSGSHVGRRYSPWSG